MRTVPEPIKLALADASLPIKKRLLLYRRKWNADTLKYALETKPIDVTDLLIEAGSIKMALDTDEVDKWDASNVTLIFNNDLNCFKEGLTGGLFENAVLWGSKVVYNIETAEKGAPTASITVFTGYVYSSPVFRDNGNRLELTVTSSLDALEYVSAESFCLTKTDELATAVTSQNSKDQGKEFATTETGVGYVDEVKYGADFESAQTLSAGNDYDLSDTNEYTKPAVVKLKFTPTDGYKMWLSYRYWHKDMAIEDIVNALLDLAGVEKRQVEKAVFNGGAKEYVADIQHKNYNLFCGFDEDNVITPQFPRNDRPDLYNNNMLWYFNIGKKSETSQSLRVRFPSKGFLGLMSPIAVFDTGCDEDKTQSYINFQSEDGTELKVSYSSRYGDHVQTTLSAKIGNVWQILYSQEDVGIVGLNFKNSCIELLIAGIWGNVGRIPTSVGLSKISIDAVINTEFSSVSMYLKSGTYYSETLTAQISWREKGIEEVEYLGKSIQTFLIDFFASPGCFALQPRMAISAILPEGAVSWDIFSYKGSIVNNGTGVWEYETSEDGQNWEEKQIIKNRDKFLSSAKYLNLYLTIPSYPGYITAENVLIGSLLSRTVLPLVNLTDLSVGEAVAQLAKMVAYEIGFNQDGVFFFRSRQGRYAETELTPNVLVEVDNHSADIDSLANRISVEYGQFKTIIDDFTEQKARPNSIDQYGVHEKTISNDNFIPADNVDISGAVAKANYEALSTPGYTLQAECRPDLSLELGDKITVCSENTNIAAKNWSDYNKFLKLPVWKRVFKIIGIELSFSKRLMSLTLKDVTTAADVPTMEYNVYQTQFPTPLNYKE